MKKIVLCLSGLLNCVATRATVNIPLQVAVSSAEVKTVSFGQSTTMAGPVRPVTPPAPASRVAWVYRNGKLNWGWDLSFAASAVYNDTSGVPLEGPADIKVTYQQFGGWQIAISQGCQVKTSSCFDTAPYNYLIFSAKPTALGLTLKSAILSRGDTADGINLFDLGPYCSGGDNPPVGQWESCKVPLSAYKLTDKVIFKFSIGDNSRVAPDVIYFDDVGFSP
jgi:hypothetical protein